MSRFGLVGPSYASQSPNLDAEACVNLYVEQDDGGAGNAPLAMYSTPGTKVFANLAASGGSSNTFDKVIETSAATSTPATSSGAPSAAGELALLIVTSGNDGSPITTPAGWTFLANLDGSETILYTKALAGTGNITSSAPLAGGAANWLTKLMFFHAKTAGVAATLVQSTAIIAGAFSNPNTFSAALTPTVAGNGLLVTVSGGTVFLHGTLGINITDTQGNIYQQIGTTQFSPGAVPGFVAYCAVFWAPNVAAGANTVTAQLTGAGTSVSGAIKANEIAGIIGISTGPIRGEFAINGRAFAVCGSNFVELFANGSFTTWGAVSNDSLPVTMAASPQQLLLASAGTAYIFDLMANTLTAIPGATFDGPVAQAAICDDFFILTIQNSKTFFVSAPLDATDWVTNGSAIVSVFPDNIVSMYVFQRQVWFFSDTQSVVYYDSGNIFPFDVNPNAFIEAGCAAENSPVIFNNSIAWLGSDARGNGKVWLANGYTPTRISNHAVEFAIQGYARIDDAVGFSYQDQGHEFYALYFPTPSVTWAYDAMTGMWHQRGFWLESIGAFRAAHYQNHIFAFGKHLVGDWQSANVYQLSIPVRNAAGSWDFADDAGNPIRRVRRAPHVSREQKRQFHIELQIYLETGLGPIPPLLDGAGKARAPQLMLSWSDDGGHTFGSEFILDCGQGGDFRKRVRQLRLGRTRDRVYQISMSDPIPWRVVDGYLEVVEGTGT